MSHEMGRYCKAYPVARFREYPRWTETTANFRPADDAAPNAGPRTLAEEDFFFLQENYTVTDDIFLDQYVVFDQVTPEWVEFCTQVLAFEVPADVADADAAEPVATA